MKKFIWFRIPVAALIASSSVGGVSNVSSNVDRKDFVGEFATLDLKNLPFEIAVRGSCGCRLKQNASKDRERKNG